MAIKIVISDTVGIKVKGTINDAAGNPQPFDFSLTCKRLTADQIKDRHTSHPDETILGFMQEILTGWGGVRDGDDQPLPYSPDNYALLCKNIAGIAPMAYQTYLLEVGAKEKN